MNNKGYTLVELLAVFVVLGVTIMISVPIISSVINTSKEKSYNEQVKILEEAARTYMSRNSKELPPYENTYKCITVEKLKSDGFIKDKDIKNPVGKTEDHEEKNETFDGGVLVSYKNNKYTYKYVDDCNNTKFNNVKVYAINTDDIYKNTSTLDSIGQTYSSCSETGKNVCLRYTLENNIVTGAEVCFVKDSVESCLQGWVDECQYDENTGDCTYTGTTSVLNTNKLVLQSAFTEENVCDDYGSSFNCYVSGWHAGADDVGGAFANDGTWSCNVDPDGYAYCFAGGD